MATTSSFDVLINEYLSDKLFATELEKRDLVLQKIRKKNDWKIGQTLVVPFRAANPTSVKSGALTAENDISEMTPLRGYESAPVEIWSSLLFNHRDLGVHSNGKIPEQTFLKILPDMVDDFIQYNKEVVSQSIVSGPYFAKVTSATDAASGIMVVDRIDRFQKGQKVILDDDDSGAGTYYVTAVNMDDSKVTLSATRGGGAANVSAFSVAQNAVFYHDGFQSSNFVSMKQAFLSAANGGSSTLHNQTKTTYSNVLAALNISGASITASNILEKLFDAWISHRSKARVGATDILVSYKHLGSILKILESQKGGFKAVDKPKASLYGWTEIEIASLGNGQALKVIASHEMNDSEIFFVDWNSMCFVTDGEMFKKRVGPDGGCYHTVRATTGFYYILDMTLSGVMTYEKPANNLVIHSISY